MTCREVQRVELLTDYLGGDLAPAAVAGLEQHLESCRTCAAHVDLYRRLTCREFIENYLDDYVAGALDPDVMARLDRHLAICPACRAYLDTYRCTGPLAARAGRAEMPQEMHGELLTFLLQRLGLPYPDPVPADRETARDRLR